MQHNVLILDFGSKYTQLIAYRCAKSPDFVAPPCIFFSQM